MSEPTQITNRRSAPGLPPLVLVIGVASRWLGSIRQVGASLLVVLAVATVGLLAGGGARHPEAAASQAVPVDAPSAAEAALDGRLIVAFRSHTLPHNAEATVAAAGGRVLAAIPQIGVMLAEPASGGADAVAGRLGRNPAVLGTARDIPVSLVEPFNVRTQEGAEPAGHVPHPAFAADDAFFPGQWSMARIGANGVTLPAAGAGPGAWDVATGAGTVIAVLDTGVSPLHPDIAPNLVTAISVSTIESPCDTNSPVDQFGHGTWIASLAAGAAGVGTGGVIGAAPEAGIMSVKVLQRIPAPPPNSAPDPGLAARCNAGEAFGSFFDVLAGVTTATALGGT